MATVANIITSKIIESLQLGVAPWRKPWGACGVQNVVTGKEYRGINRLLLSITGNDDFFLTYKQAKDLGGSVKKGAKSSLVVFYSPIKDANENTVNRRFILRYYNVFALNDTENVKFERPKFGAGDLSVVEKCESLIAKISTPIIHGGSRACFSPSENNIQMPEKGNFKSALHYYATLFHEIGHSLVEKSGEAHTGSFGSEPYAKEELTAEIFSCFACQYCGIDTSDLFDNSTAYLSSWVKKLQNDTNFIISAASKAQRRFDWIVGNTAWNEPEPESAE